MQKDFDYWNNQKKHIDKYEHARLYAERELWWCALGVKIGFEEIDKATCLTPLLRTGR